MATETKTNDICDWFVVATEFAQSLAVIARAAGKPAGLVVDSVSDYEGFRVALGEAGLPVFARAEEAIAGLHVLV
jgi:hypothetical protein